tara:strand:+ start:65 stop:433 length:369 start_codon:yes stop_codon:yes gene_type:complete
MRKLLFLLLIAGCTIQPKPKIQITHVLAIDEKGDTLRIPIDLIRPINYRIINYSGYSGWGYNYGYNNPYYYNHHREYDYSQGSTGRSSNNNNTNSNTNSKVPERANNKPTPPKGVTNKIGNE